MGVNLAFETGLYKYFNAGAQLSFGIPRSLEEPLHLGLGLFAKPYFPIGDRCSIFSLAGAGLSAAQNSMKTWLSERHKQEIERVYLYSDYYNTAFGGNVYLSVGIEYFPWPLLGFAFAGGVRAELWRERGLTTQKKLLMTLVMPPMSFQSDLCCKSFYNILIFNNKR